jgi:hypothetical protein
VSTGEGTVGDTRDYFRMISQDNKVLYDHLGNLRPLWQIRSPPYAIKLSAASTGATDPSPRQLHDQ